jgi:hypothetical protein
MKPVRRWTTGCVWAVGYVWAIGLLVPARAAELPDPVVPAGLGVNIHFTDPRPGEMDMLAAGGFTIVRMDFSWGATEREKGTYDFSAYDRLLAALAPHKIRALWILDYSNRHYDNDQSPASPEARRAFARWAAAAAVHFRGRGILWEMYNEPNIGFWRPKPDVNQYVPLALEVGRAIRAAAPGERYIGPATSGVDMPFLEACFKAGLLEYWDAVSVHPYRQTAPETAAADYAKLRRLIARHAPKGKNVPIHSGEWGYSSAWKGMDPVRQGKLLPRQWLVNLSNDVPISIWYDWHDDGPDPKEPEHHFGTVLEPFHAGRKPVYDPKPAYQAAQTLTAQLRGFRFNKRLCVGSAEDYVLLFARGSEVRLAAWTTSDAPREATIPASPGRFGVVGHTGAKLPPLAAGPQGLKIRLTDAPQYLAPQQPNDLLRIAAAWQRAPSDLDMPAADRATIALGLTNPLDREIQVSTGAVAYVSTKPIYETPKSVQPGRSLELATPFRLTRSSEPMRVRAECRVAGLGVLAQAVEVRAANPMDVRPGAPYADRMRLQVENPSGEAFQGTLALTDVSGLSRAKPSVPLELRAGQTSTWIDFPLAGRPTAAYRFGICVVDAKGNLQLAQPARRFRLVDDFSRYDDASLWAAWEIAPDGDAKVGSQQSIAPAPAPPDGPTAEKPTLRIVYRVEEGWKFVRLATRVESMRPIEGRPRELGVWVYGDGSGNTLRVRIVDAAGQTFQPDGPPMIRKGWQYVAFRLDGRDAGHWGGANDGKIRFPIRWDSILLIDSTRRAGGPWNVHVASPVLVYD